MRQDRDDIKGDNKWVTLVQNAARARIKSKAKRAQRSGCKSAETHTSPKKRKKPEKAGHVKHPEPAPNTYV